MKKQLRRFNVPFDFNWAYGVEIKKLKDDLDILEKLGATEIEIEVQESYGSASVSIEAFTHRIETDEEYNTRINKENERQEDIKRRELAELEKLKSKYGM